MGKTMKEWCRFSVVWWHTFRWPVRRPDGLHSSSGQPALVAPERKCQSVPVLIAAGATHEVDARAGTSGFRPVLRRGHSHSVRLPLLCRPRCSRGQSCCDVEKRKEWNSFWKSPVLSGACEDAFLWYSEHL
jgi:hypothetical protein